MDVKHRRRLLAVLVVAILTVLGLRAREEREALAALPPPTQPPAATAPLTVTAPAARAEPPPVAEPVPTGQGEGQHDPVALASMPSPVQNDPILPELPQTARWKSEKAQHLTGLLQRDVARLVQERDAARTRGDATRAAQLDVLLTRSHAQLERVQREAAAHAEAAKAEPPEPVVEAPTP